MHLWGEIPTRAGTIGISRGFNQMNGNRGGLIASALTKRDPRRFPTRSSRSFLNHQQAVSSGSTGRNLVLDFKRFFPARLQMKTPLQQAAIAVPPCQLIRC